jgi:hypothetical protein
MISGAEPTSGYMVAKGSKYGAVADAVDFYDPIKGPEILANYMIKHKSNLGTGKNYLGLWHNTEDGKVYLDISENIQDQGRAKTLGAKRDQISIWDVVNFAEINTGGTGNVEKDGSYSDSEHYGNDGRTNSRVHQRTLGKNLKTIRFEAGLKPTFKHLQGQHDQSTHGAWANGGYSEEQQAGMAAMQDLGPSIEDLDNAYNALSANANGPSLDEMKSIVENDQGLYEQATDGIDAIVDEKMAERKYEYADQAEADSANEALRNRLYEQTQNEMVDEFINNESDMINQLYEEQNGGSALDQVAQLEGYMNEVYSYEHTGKDAAGNDVTLYSEVTNMEPSSYVNGGIKIYGQVVANNGDIAGEFERTMYKENNVWMVEHDLFQMYDDYKGAGFGTKFIQQQEDWYTTRNFGAVVVGTAWDGARHWARAGFDFHPEHVGSDISAIATAADYDPSFGAGTENRKEFDSLMSRAVEGYQPGVKWSTQSANGAKVKSIKNSDFPLPNDFATIGIAKKTRDSEGTSIWGGKSLMYGLHLKYVKALTAEGRSIIQGPIDRDGDGLVYDGTVREKPATEVK